MCGGSGLPLFPPMFYRPRLEGHALSIPGVHVSHSSDSLKEVKKMNTETIQAMEKSHLILSAVLPTKIQAVAR